MIKKSFKKASKGMVGHTDNFTKPLYSTSWSEEVDLHHGNIFSLGQDISMMTLYGRPHCQMLIFAFKPS